MKFELDPQVVKEAEELGRLCVAHRKMTALSELPSSEQPRAMFFILFDRLPLEAQRWLVEKFGGQVFEDSRDMNEDELDAWYANLDPIDHGLATGDDGEPPMVDVWVVDHKDWLETPEEAKDEEKALRYCAELMYGDYPEMSKLLLNDSFLTSRGVQ